jgi:uncharacterized damage-inducible protein DinB
MTALEQLVRLWKHSAWADETILNALKAPNEAKIAAAIKEYAHILGAEEVWLSRVEGRPATIAVWPEIQRKELSAVAKTVHAAYAKYFASLKDADLDRVVSYKNSLGRSFDSLLGDILLHVVLHGQYHRGKVNRILRDASAAPGPVDYIVFARGGPAASLRKSQSVPTIPSKKP